MTNAPKTGRKIVAESTGTLCFQNLLAGGHSEITITSSEALELQRMAPNGHYHKRSHSVKGFVNFKISNMMVLDIPAFCKPNLRSGNS